MGEFIPLSVPNIRGNEIQYVTKALEEEWVSTAGSCIDEFENAMKQYVGSKGAVACQSGTAGLHLSLLVCGVERGDEVIVPTLTFIAAVNPVRYVGAEPLFMDCDDSLTIDVEKLRSFLKEECVFENGVVVNRGSGRKVKAIVVVHVFGNMADMAAIMAIAKEYNLKVIEDATEALGTYYTDGSFENAFAGTMGDIGVYSFNGNKIITTGGGGMIVSDNKEYLKQLKYLSTQAKDDMLYFVHDNIGYNYRMTNIQAAIGLAQLEQLEKFIKVKEENYNHYLEQGIRLLDFKGGVRSNKWFYSYLSEERDGLIQYLSKENIQTRPVWKLIHTQIPYKDCYSYKIEKAEVYYNKIVNLPCSSNLTKADVETVAEKIKSYTEES